MKELVRRILRRKEPEYVFAGYRTKLDFMESNQDGNDCPDPTRGKEAAIKAAEELVRNGVYYAIDVFNPADDSGEAITCVTPPVIIQTLVYGLIPESIYVFDDEALAAKNLKVLIEKHELTHEPGDVAFYKSKDEETELYIDRTNINLAESEE